MGHDGGGMKLKIAWLLALSFCLDAQVGNPGSYFRIGTVANLPATCTIGMLYFATNATAGQNQYYCTASNTWTQQLNSGTGGVTVVGAGSLTNTALVTGGGSQAIQTPCSTCSLTSGGALSVTSASTGSSPPAVTGGTSGIVGLGEGTAPTALSGADFLYADSTSHAIFSSLNGGTFYALPQRIASGTVTLATNSISSGACQTVTAGSVNSVAATGVGTTDTINWTPNGSIKAVTGFVPGTSGGLSIVAYPTSGYVNWDVCNWGSGSTTPGPVTLNWSVTR